MKKDKALKVSAIVAAALANLSANNAETNNNASPVSIDQDSVQSFNVKKPMPVLKINMANPEASKFVANHNSHKSHSSHRSHYSHRSGALFS